MILSGAGVSAESGIKTFRDHDGLWENYDVMDVATPEGWRKNPELVLKFYNERRAQLKTVQPNAAHYGLAELEKHYDVMVITQNVDDLHERAGSTRVLHLHGELLKVRSTKNSSYVLDWHHDLNLGDTDPNGNQLRPHIVWFNEEVPLIENAVEWIKRADKICVIGTSLQVYPAAGLVNVAPDHSEVVYIDPKPSPEIIQNPRIQTITATATQGIKELLGRWLHNIT